MAKPNYQHERRQKDLAKKKKAEEKRLRKAEKKNSPGEEEELQPLDGPQPQEEGEIGETPS
ncbi:MAG: hypothetical protein ABIS20_13565 [Thermoanaerobaculia bacterium]